MTIEAPSLSSAATAPVSKQAAGKKPLLALLIRLHFYIGLFVGPFIFVAALSGLLYALTPQLEDRLYADQLFTQSQGPTQPLARQIEVALEQIGSADSLAAIRPAVTPGTTTRVMFTSTGLGPSQSRAIFVDPVTVEVRGDLMVYGTTGVLPLRTWIDHFHRSLLLGEWGRLYSELAASWLWVAALGGLILRSVSRRQQRSLSQPAAAGHLRRWHASLGLVLVLGLLFFSATGLTWSQWAGGNIGVARAALGMSTPSVSTALNGAPARSHDEHAHHAHHAGSLPMSSAVDLTKVDAVLSAARMAGIESPKIEIRPADAPDRAWTVTEIDRSWPTQVDAVAIDPYTLAVVDKIEFERFPLAAKLTRWGIDAHMGSLFGLANQLLLAAAASGLLILVVWGYLMWWRRRPRRTTGAGHFGLLQALRPLSPPARAGVMALALLLGYCLPVLGASLLLFILLDSGIGAVRKRRSPSQRQPGEEETARRAAKRV